MKIFYKNKTEKIKSEESCVVTEYPMNDNDINIAFVEINGRYPTKGQVVNEKCKELAYIVEGTGKAVINNKDFKLNKGDSILIEPGESFFWEGDLEMLLPCTPAWYPEQYKKID